MTERTHFKLTEAYKFLRKIAAEERLADPDSMRASTAEELAADIDYLLRTEYTTVAPTYDEAAA
jgi:hypothetical protein